MGRRLVACRSEDPGGGAARPSGSGIAPPPCATGGRLEHIQTTTGAFVGLGFAVSINTVKALVIEQRSFWSGVQSLLLPPALARALNVPQGTGMLVQQVAHGSPAERLGLRPGELPIDVDGQRVIVGGDVILAVNGIRIDSVEAVQRIRKSLISFGPGQEMTVEVLRSGYRERLSISFQTASVE